MDIFMAAFAYAAQTGEVDAVLRDILLHRFMALPTFDSRMFAFERKFSLRMIERDVSPARYIMAVFAAALLYILIGLPGMGILMAGLASCRREFELHAGGAIGKGDTFVASDTGDGQMAFR
jgi:hypothetical protein